MSTPADALLLQLQSSLEDLRLSDDEKRSLAHALEGGRPGDETRRRLRNRAFDLVRERIFAGDARAAELVKWLEGVAKLLDSGNEAHPEIESRAYFSPGVACLEAIRQYVRRARSSLDICVFTVSDDRISSEIVAAHRRGVAVRLITDNDKEEDAGSDVEWLRDAGIPVAVDITSAHMHHKFALIDGDWLLNGSFNWTRSASEKNEENLVASNDPELVRQFRRHFDVLWKQLATSA